MAIIILSNNGISFILGIDWDLGGDYAVSLENLKDAINMSLGATLTATIDPAALDIILLEVDVAGSAGNSITIAIVDGASRNFWVDSSTLHGGRNVVFDSKYLLNAQEIFSDIIGDDDGLCESNEDCIYTPNLGSYQGHGDFVSAQTVVSNTQICPDIGAGGSIENVTLYKYSTNGR